MMAVPFGLRSGRRSIAAGALVWLVVACSSAEENRAPAPQVLMPGERKQRMLLATETVFLQITRDARRDMAAARAEFEAAVKAAPRTVQLAVSDEALESYGASVRQVRRTAIEDAQKVAEAKLTAILEHYESALWTVAAEAGKLEHGSALGYRSGYKELDEKVDAAMLQLSRDADVDGIAQAATLHVYDHIAMDRELREELPNLGVLSFYKSQPIKGLFDPAQEGVATVVVFNRNGLDPAVPVSFVQAVRRLLERGGIVVDETPWQLDPGTPDGNGVVALIDEVDPRQYVATDTCIPAVDTHTDGFKNLFDHVLVSEYRTALRRDDTGELLGVVGWMVRWNVDFRGTMRVLVDRQDLFLEDDPVIPRILAHAGSAARSGSGATHQ